MSDVTRVLAKEYNPEQARATLDRLHDGMRQRFSVSPAGTGYYCAETYSPV